MCVFIQKKLILDELAITTIYYEPNWFLGNRFMNVHNLDESIQRQETPADAKLSNAQKRISGFGLRAKDVPSTFWFTFFQVSS